VTVTLTVDDLVARLRAMSVEDIRRVGHLVRGEHGSAADEIAWWSATARVERLVRRQQMRRAAAMAAAAASQAVKRAALSCELALNDPDVVATARAASDAAGALVVGHGAVAEASYFVDRLGLSFADAASPASVAV
jgi:hypothetical protein